MKIHILGPSGSGITTLGRAISKRFGMPQFDSDEYFWIPSDPPFQTKRPASERIALMHEDLNAHDSWIVSGSALTWGDFLRDESDLIIYLYIERDCRIERLMNRETERFGDRIKPGRDMHASHVEFIQWASSYEDGSMEMRSRLAETEWLKKARGHILRIETEIPLEEEMSLVENAIREIEGDHGE